MRSPGKPLRCCLFASREDALTGTAQACREPEEHARIAGVLVNAIGQRHFKRWTAPGGIAQQIATAQRSTREPVLKEIASRIPLRRLPTPEETAAVITLRSSETARNITDATSPLDGGAVP